MNSLVQLKLWPKFWECWPINLMDVLLVVEVTEFIAKQTCMVSIKAKHGHSSMFCMVPMLETASSCSYLALMHVKRKV